nr:MAG TPA: hypothetical protein [Caudoviricetes sp.]
MLDSRTYQLSWFPTREFLPATKYAKGRFLTRWAAARSGPTSPSQLQRYNNYFT